MKKLIALFLVSIGFMCWAGSINVLVLKFDVSESKKLNGVKLTDALIAQLKDTPSFHFVNEKDKDKAKHLLESSRTEKPLSDEENRFVLANFTQRQEILVTCKVAVSDEEVRVKVKAVRAKNGKAIFEDGFQFDPKKNPDIFSTISKSSADLIQKAFEAHAKTE